MKYKQVLWSGVRQLLQPAPQLLRQQPGPGGLPHQPHGRLQLPGGGVRGPRPRPDMTSTTLKVSEKFEELNFWRKYCKNYREFRSCSKTVQTQSKS